MWCDKCKHSSEELPKDVEVVVLKPNDTKEVEVSLGRIVVTEEEVRQGLDIEQLKKQQMELIKRTYLSLKERYPMIIWCSRKGVFVVCNPERPTTIVDMEKECPFFEPK
ncbi:MAG TPA: hypothetical protein ENG74_01690 [Thermoplasmatales archaeon]|nr:hypothetical protein [Thermoplasmatales archaeon]